MYVPPERNATSIQFAALCATLDAAFHQAHDALTDAYYPYRKRKYDVQPTPVESKLARVLGLHREAADHRLCSQQQCPHHHEPPAIPRTRHSPLRET